jgi:hypothetical protein
MNHSSATTEAIEQESTVDGHEEEEEEMDEAVLKDDDTELDRVFTVRCLAPLPAFLAHYGGLTLFVRYRFSRTFTRHSIENTKRLVSLT